MKNDYKFFLVILGLLILGGLGAYFFTPKTNTTPGNLREPLITTDDNIITGRSIGNPNASVRIVEWADFQCPACAMNHPIVNQILKEYDGKIYFTYRNFPLPSHKNAIPAAMAVESAGRQNKYWEMYGIIYDKQKEWENAGNAEEIYQGYARELGLDLEQFKKDQSDKEIESSIKREASIGSSAGINATPTFFINGKSYVGVQQYSKLKTIIDSELANTQPAN